MKRWGNNDFLWFVSAINVAWSVSFTSVWNLLVSELILLSQHDAKITPIPVHSKLEPTKMSHKSVSDKPWMHHCSCFSCHSLSTSRHRERGGQKYPEGRIHIGGSQWHWAFMQCCVRVRIVERNVSEWHTTSNFWEKKSQCRKNRCLSGSIDCFRRAKFHRVHHNHWLIWEGAQQLLLRVKANQAIKVKMAGEVVEDAKRSPNLQDRAVEWQDVGSAGAERVLAQAICAVGQGNRGQTCCIAKSKERYLENDSQS